MDVGKVAAPDGMDRGRREALKRFARYAAAAPTTMVLLQPSESYAGPKKAKKPRAKRRRALLISGTPVHHLSNPVPQPAGPVHLGRPIDLHGVALPLSDHLLVVAPNGMVVALDPGGRHLWKRSRPVAPRTIWSMPASAMATSRAMWLAPTLHVPWRRGARWD